jgi:pyruvate dehydrogenase E2 component (dihydrolipoamide acetyltransferase)
VTRHEIRIPDIGDAEGVEVVEVLAKPGAMVAADDPLIVIESDKASMEVPSTAAGRVASLAVSVGDAVQEGQLIAVVESDEVAPAPEPPRPAPLQSEANDKPGDKPAPTTAAPGGAPARYEVRVPDIGDAHDVTVVEVGVKVGQTVAVDDLLVVLESDKASMEIPAPVSGKVLSVDVAPDSTVEEGTLLAIIETSDEHVEAAVAAQPTATEEAPKSDAARPQPAPPRMAPVDEAAPSPRADGVYAGPAVRRLARELGVDLARVSGSGMRGRILKTDVEAFVKQAMTAGVGVSARGGIPPVAEVDHAKFGPVEVVPLTRIRARGAENLQRSWLNVVHVTQHDDADVTDLEAFRAELKVAAQRQEIKLTPLPFILLAVVAMLREYPRFNASLDAGLRNLVVKQYVNIGIAVDTPNGLIVPVLRDAPGKGVFELAKAIESLSQKAQNGKLSINETQGATFTVSSLGAIGGLGFTPIVNAPEIAILGVSRVTTKPQWTGNEFVPRQMLPLSLSYDHRAINGAEAGRFLTGLCRTLQDIRRLLL